MMGRAAGVGLGWKVEERFAWAGIFGGRFVLDRLRVS